MPRLSFALLLAGFAATAACAQPAAGPEKPAVTATPASAGKRVHLRLAAPDPDLNHDGKVTLEELESVEHRGMVAHLDTNHDGAVDRQEFKVVVDLATMKGGEAAGKRAAGLFVILDADHDGVISEAERDAATRRRFAQVDLNHDGWLSKDELSAISQKRRRAN